MAKYVTRRNRFRGGRLRKRWYFNAGANLPFVGKTTVSMGSGKAKRSIVNLVRNSLEDPLHKIVGAAVAPLHNTVYSLNLTGNIPRGDTDGSRTADTIHIDAIKFTVLATNSGAANLQNVKHFRFMIIKSDTDLYAGSDAWGSSLGATSIWYPATGSASLIVSQNNAKQCIVLYEKTVAVAPQLGTTIHTVRYSDIIRYGQKFVYKTGTDYGKHYNLYAVLLTYEVGATTGSTAVGNFLLSTDMIFKDSK